MNQSPMNTLLGATLAILACGFARPSSAEWFPIADDVLGWGTAACTQGGEVPRCFGIRCNGTLPHPGAEWFFFADDGAITDAAVSVSIQVDASLAQALFMLPMTSGGYLIHHAPVSLESHWAFIKALQSGFGSTITMNDYPPFSLSLQGSNSEIQRALNACAPVGRSRNDSVAASCESEYRARLHEAERLAAMPNGRLAADGKRLDAEVRLNLCRQGSGPRTSH
ncbi:hypothetical protein [Marivita sp.]|uniref:hypothetical protein n=1 Tax=Marivita sp. TaxID=2003365 RepID=UPI00261362A3|nr:hypothetical protein [Marivita sp.]